MAFSRHNVILAIIFTSVILFAEFFIFVEAKKQEVDLLKYMGTKSNNIEDSMVSIINSAALINTGLKYILLNTKDEKVKSEFEKFVLDYNVNLPYIKYIVVTKDNEILYSYIPSKTDVRYDFSLIEQTFRTFPQNRIWLSTPKKNLSQSLKISSPVWLGNDLLVIHTAIDFDSLVIYSNLTTYAKNISYALIDIENSEFLSGNPNLYEKNAQFIKKLNFYNGRWNLLLKGIDDNAFARLSFRLFMLFVAIVLVYIIGIIFRQQEQIEEQNLFDKTTRCMKLNFFIQILKNHIPYAQRQRASFSLIYMKVRGLTYVNRKFGSKIKSFVLEEISNQIKQNIRKSDVVAIIPENNEFVILIKNSKDLKAIDTVTCKLTKNILSPLIYKNEVIQVRLNIGCSSYPKEATEAEDLVATARANMNQSSY